MVYTILPFLDDSIQARKSRTRLHHQQGCHKGEWNPENVWAILVKKGIEIEDWTVIGFGDVTGGKFEIIRLF